MSLVLNTNVASLNAQRNLAATQNQQATTFERLSTGLRVNSAKDDAAGLFLAQAQTKDITGLNMATRNAGDGISLAQTAEGALDQIGQNLQRINELAIQSANGTYSQSAREGLQAEVDELTQEINRIVETTEFNGQKLLNSEAATSVLQVGFGNNTASRIETGIEGGLAKLDGMDQATFFGSNQTFRISSSDLASGTVAGNRDLTDAFAEQVGFVNAAGNVTDTVGEDLARGIANQMRTIQGSFDNLTDALVARVEAGEGTATSPLVFNAGGIEFHMVADAAGAVTSLTGYYGGTGRDSNGVPENATTLDFGTASLTSLNGDYSDKNEFGGRVGEIDGVLSLGTNSLVSSTSTAPNLDIHIFSGNALKGVLDGDMSSTRTIDISTQGSAQRAIQATRNAIDSVSELRAEFGANMNRFEAVISGNQTYSENLSAARSRIQDADFAVETANLAKQQVLQQAGISALGQANASSQAILGLL